MVVPGGRRKTKRKSLVGMIGLLLMCLAACLLLMVVFLMTTLEGAYQHQHRESTTTPFWEQSTTNGKRVAAATHQQTVKRIERQPHQKPEPMPRQQPPKHQDNARTARREIADNIDNTAASFVPPASTTELIDMRELSYELPFSNPDGGAWKQGWNVVPRPPSDTQKLQIFVLPHSHCDPGWIKTFDQYFRQQTSGILTTVVNALAADARRKFIWAEISYFSWWWEEQNSAMQQTALDIIQSGQLEFVTGGWVQPDEANSELYAMEVQLQEGHQWIRENIGPAYVPRYSWSIDPFGYSPTAAYLWQKYNMTGMLIQRVHYAVKKELAKRKHLEFYWRQTWDNGKDSQKPHQHDIFTHVMPFFSYDVPHTCGPDPAVCCQFDFARMRGVTSFTCPWNQPPQKVTDTNVANRAAAILEQYRKKAALYRSQAVLIPLGDDFRFQTPKEAESQFTNYQKLFDYINSHYSDVQIQWGTLSQYFEAAKTTFPGTVPILKGSFFTYSDVNEDYWSGYFTSRVFDKALDRRLERVLYAAETMGAVLPGPRRALSLFQHHDGVTGTAKNHVVRDYAQRIHNAIHETEEWIVEHNRDVLPASHHSCLTSPEPRKLSENVCSGKVVAYNPLEDGVTQSCGSVEVPSRSFTPVTLPCETPLAEGTPGYVFDAQTGLMLEPIKEEWKYWAVTKGGAYLFVPGTLKDFELVNQGVVISNGGAVVETEFWKRTVIERKVSGEGSGTATVLDFIYETNLQADNQEWLARFSANIQNEGYFHTDLNGFNFDTHRFRSDLPIQSQVFPMPTLASIEDNKQRMTIISEHAQGTASLQDGSVDIWLDRRIRQDDNRGLGQGVLDNTRTRTRLRVMLEKQSFDTTSEFDVTPLGRRMWNEVQHPLELYGELNSEVVQHQATAMHAAPNAKQAVDNKRLLRNNKKMPKTASKPPPERDLHSIRTSVDDTNVPFVIMVYKRVDYLQQSVESIRNSDFPAKRLPLVISVDGHVQEVIDYVESLKDEFQIELLVHPFSCHDHPKSFPGDDPKLNEGYKGDKYHNPRTAKITCCKHHFTWLLSTVFSMDKLVPFETFVFLEEDYVVAPSIYKSVAAGLDAMEELKEETNGGFLGISFDPTHGGMKSLGKGASPEFWSATQFISGPMTLNRSTFLKIKENSDSYCGVDGFDEYNWDWTFVHMGVKKILPHTVLEPTQMLTKHIGLEGGMHEHKKTAKQRTQLLDTEFVGTKFRGSLKFPARTAKPNGGWGHPADKDHCMNVLKGTAVETTA